MSVSAPRSGAARTAILGGKMEGISKNFDTEKGGETGFNPDLYTWLVELLLFVKLVPVKPAFPLVL